MRVIPWIFNDLYTPPILSESHLPAGYINIEWIAIKLNINKLITKLI